MKRTALTIGAQTLGIVAALTLLGGCATDGNYYGGGGGYYGSYGYYDGYYGPDYYPGVYGYAYVPRGGYGGGGRDHRGDHHRGDRANNGDHRNWNRGDHDGGQRGNWNGGNRGNWRNNQAAGANTGGDRITRGNFWRQNQSQAPAMNAQPRQSAPAGGGGGWRGRRGPN